MMALAMPLTWLLQANLRDRRTLDELCRTLDDLGEAWRAEPLIPFSAELPALAPELETGAVVCYGPSFVPRVVGRGWRPGIFFDPAQYRWSVMQQHWRALMFSRDGALTSLSDALDALDATGEEAFIRPDADDKLFDGARYDAAGLRAATKGCAPTTEVIRAAPRAVDAEWRCFVVDGEIVAGSEYRRAGRPSLYGGVPPRVAELVAEAARGWLPAPVVCIDVASSGDHVGILEANCFNAARFYAADLAEILRCVSAHCRARYT